MTDNEFEKIFRLDWWPLEMAVTWVATGQKRHAASVYNLTLGHRLQSERALEVELFLLIQHRSAQFEAIPGSVFRQEARGPDSRSVHGPYEWAICETARVLQSRHTTGVATGGNQRNPIPSCFWRNAIIEDDKKRGMYAKTSSPSPSEWFQIDVPACAFRVWRPRRGRPAKSLRQKYPSEINNAVELIKTSKSHRTEQARKSTSASAKMTRTFKSQSAPTLPEIAAQSGLSETTVARLSSALKKSGYHSPRGRPQGSRNVLKRG